MFKETTGRIAMLIDTKYGKTKSGKDYETRDYLLEVAPGTEYSHHVKFAMQSFDGPIQNPLQVGQEVKVGLKIIAHQYNGKWYNEVTLMTWEPLT